MTRVIIEISGRDSIAAALRFAQENEVTSLLPTYVHTGTEYGDFGEIKRNVSLLKEKLKEPGVTLDDLVERSAPELWWAINGRHVSTLLDRFGFWVPCLGCHLYLHLMRVPLAREVGATTIVAGEREHHGEEIKLNQTAAAIDAYTEVLDSAGLRLALPIRHVRSDEEMEAILGSSWPAGTRQMRCVLSGNYRRVDGHNRQTAAVSQEYLKRYLIPAGKRLAEAIKEGKEDYLRIVEDVLRSA